jgi:hypothetical protein
MSQKRNLAGDKRAARLRLAKTKSSKWCNGFVIPKRTDDVIACLAQRRDEVIDSLNKKRRR